MITNVNLPAQIENRLLLLAHELGKREEELIQEAIINYLENWEKLKLINLTEINNLETALLSESSLEKDWLDSEEDLAWQNL